MTTVDLPTSTPSRLRPAAVIGATVAFGLIGAQQALYGPSIPALRAAHHISAAAAGAALSVHFAGAILGVFGLAVARRLRLADSGFLAGSLVLIAVGCALFLLAPNWPLALLAAFAAGVGFGGIDGGVNQIFTEVYAEGGHGVLNLLHGCFGVGAILGPVAVGLLPSYGWSFAACALVAVAALPLRRNVTGAPAGPGSARVHRGGLLGMVGMAFLAFFVLHVGLETSAGGWETTHLIATGLSQQGAASATSGFWLAFTASRFAVVPLCRRYSARAIVLACTALTVAAATSTVVDPFAPFAYGLLGLAVGPLFPTGLAWLAERRPALISMVVALSMLGGIAFPPAIGLAVEAFGPTAVPKAMIILAVLALATVLLIGRERRPIDHASPLMDEAPAP